MGRGRFSGSGADDHQVILFTSPNCEVTGALPHSTWHPIRQVLDPTFKDIVGLSHISRLNLFRVIEGSCGVFKRQGLHYSPDQTSLLPTYHTALTGHGRFNGMCIHDNALSKE